MSKPKETRMTTQTDMQAEAVALLAEIDARLAVCEKATPGRWAPDGPQDLWRMGTRYATGGEEPDQDNPEHHVFLASMACACDLCKANNYFIADSRNHRPGELAALRALVEMAQGWLMTDGQHAAAHLDAYRDDGTNVEIRRGYGPLVEHDNAIAVLRTVREALEVKHG